MVIDKILGREKGETLRRYEEQLEKRTKEKQVALEKIKREKEEEELREEIEIGGGKIFYNEDGIIVNEQDLNNIFWEYFRGTDLENVSYQ